MLDRALVFLDLCLRRAPSHPRRRVLWDLIGKWRACPGADALNAAAAIQLNPPPKTPPRPRADLPLAA